MKTIQELEQDIENLTKRIKVLEDASRSSYKFPCNHQTTPFGVNKRRCGICGEIFVVNS